MQFSVTFSTNQSSDEIIFALNLDDVTIETWTAEHGKKTVAFQVDDTDETASRIISIEMSGKKDHHTELDNDGNIINDHFTEIENITFDQIDVTDQYCQGNRCYTHQNGHTDEFYGFVGINGVVCFDFYTPLWKWFDSKCK